MCLDKELVGLRAESVFDKILNTKTMTLLKGDIDYINIKNALKGKGESILRIQYSSVSSQIQKGYIDRVKRFTRLTNPTVIMIVIDELRKGEEETLNTIVKGLYNFVKERDNLRLLFCYNRGVDQSSQGFFFSDRVFERLTDGTYYSLSDKHEESNLRYSLF